MNNRQIDEANALALPYSQNITALDTTPAIAIQYVPDMGAGGFGSTSVGKVKITSDGLRFKVDDTTPAGIDALQSMTASGWLPYSTQTNMGQLLEKINGSLAWRAIPKCMLQGDIASNLLAVAEAIVSNAVGKVFFWDSKVETLIVAGGVISGERFVNAGRNGHVTDAADLVNNTLLMVEANIVDSNMTFTVHSASNTAEGLAISVAFTAAGTATFFGKQNPDDLFIQSVLGERLVIKITGPTEAIGTPTQVTIRGKSAVYKNDRIVQDVQVTN